MYMNSLSKDLENAKVDHCKHAHSKFVKVAPELKKEKFQKLNTLRINKIENIMSEEYKIHGVKAFDLHLLNMKHSNTKYLQIKDVIEIALIFCLFDANKVYNLCELIFSWIDDELSEVNYKFPLSIYKLMLFYEELEGFHMLFDQEPIYKNRIRIISECLSYSLII